jgi:hypothetical protein
MVDLKEREGTRLQDLALVLFGGLNIVELVTLSRTHLQ